MPHIGMTVKCPLLYFIWWEENPGDREGRWRAPGRAGSPKVSVWLWLLEATIPQGERMGSPVKLSYPGSTGLHLGWGAQAVTPYDLLLFWFTLRVSLPRVGDVVS